MTCTHDPRPLDKLVVDMVTFYPPITLLSLLSYHGLPEFMRKQRKVVEMFIIVQKSNLLKWWYFSFSLSRNKHGTKKYIWNCPVEGAKKMKCYKRLKYKQFVQISGLCGPRFLSYLPKHFTHHCRALYGNAILVDRNCLPIWPPEINKNIGSSLFL